MKKGKCLVCGGLIPLEEKTTNCPSCNVSINYDLLLKKDKIELLKHDALMYTINKEYKKVLLFIDNNYNNLLLEYYRMFSTLKLDKEYIKTNFYNTNLKYSEKELDTIIHHMIENQEMFNHQDILSLINKSNNKDYYVSILNSNKEKELEKTKEKDLRELLFNKTIVPKVKPIDKTKEESIVLSIIGIALYVILFLIVLIFTNKTLKYSLFNILTILPSILFAKSLPYLIFKDNKLIYKILVFIITLYILTLPGLMFTKDYTLLNHIIGLLKSPIDFFELLIERMQPYEK